MYKQILMVLDECEGMCEYMTTYIKMRVEPLKPRVKQLRMLRDCADICTLTSKYIARDSYFAKCIAELCAFICQECGKECSKFPDQMSQQCAKICLHCAKECQAFAKS